MMKMSSRDFGVSVPPCPKCGTAEAVRAMTSLPGQFFCARCQLSLPLENSAANDEKASNSEESK